MKNLESARRQVRQCRLVLGTQLCDTPMLSCGSPYATDWPLPRCYPLGLSTRVHYRCYSAGTQKFRGYPASTRVLLVQVPEYHMDSRGIRPETRRTFPVVPQAHKVHCHKATAKPVPSDHCLIMPQVAIRCIIIRPMQSQCPQATPQSCLKWQ